MVASGLIAVTAPPALGFQNECQVRIDRLESQTGVLAPYGVLGLTGSQIAFQKSNNAGGVTLAGKEVKLAPVPGMKDHYPANDPVQSIALVRRMAAERGIIRCEIGSSAAGMLPNRSVRRRDALI